MGELEWFITMVIWENRNDRGKLQWLYARIGIISGYTRESELSIARIIWITFRAIIRQTHYVRFLIRVNLKCSGGVYVM